MISGCGNRAGYRSKTGRMASQAVLLCARSPSLWAGVCMGAGVSSSHFTQAGLTFLEL